MSLLSIETDGHIITVTAFIVLKSKSESLLFVKICIFRLDYRDALLIIYSLKVLGISNFKK